MRWRLILAFLAVILVTLLSLSFWIQKSTVEVVDNFFRRGVNFGAETLVEELEDHYSIYGNWELAEEIILKNTDHTMINTGGQGQSGQTQNGQFQSRPALNLIDKNGNLLFGAQVDGVSEKIDADILEKTTALSLDGEVIGYLLPNDLRFFNAMDYSENLGTQIQNAAFNTILIAGAVSILFAFILGYFLLIPVRRLTSAAKDLAKGDFSKKVNITGATEFVTLGETFNYLAESLQSTEKQRQAMTADIAHELRTPLAIQRANLEAMQDGIFPIDQENISLLLSQNEMLNEMVEDLRLLALTDSNELSLVLEPIDFNQHILSTVELFKSQAEKKGIKLNYISSDDLEVVNADPGRLSQILNNLLSNGLRHTPENGEIKLILSNLENNNLLEVIDSGPGFSEDVLPYIFDRFYRGDSSRARDLGGSGLGLTISRRLAEAMGGSLSASNHPKGGAILSLMLPIKE